MSKVEDFLTYEEEQEIVEAIRMAESETSGEIRVHIEKQLPWIRLIVPWKFFTCLKWIRLSLKMAS